MTEIKYAFRSEIGKARFVNQDFVLINKIENIYMVADGMGGHLAGEIASSLTCKTIEKYLVEHKEKISNYSYLIREAVKTANKVVYEEGAKEEYRGMGTTITLLMVALEKYYVAQVGDSRAYLIREGKISQITEDHSYVYELFKKGILNKRQMMYHPFKNILTRAVGSNKEVEIDTFSGEIYPNDYFLLTTDGLIDKLEDKEILEIILHYVEPEVICQNLLSYAHQKDGYDDKTFLIIYIPKR